jgi:hypothetical protein
MSLLFRNMCGGDDGGDSCPGAYLCARAESTCAMQSQCAAQESCIDFGEPDARCGSATSCDATRTCDNPDEACICFD